MKYKKCVLNLNINLIGDKMTNFQAKTVLIVEDDEESNHNLAFFLKNRFEMVLSAYNGLEGWKLYNEYCPDLILTDIEMPIMDGLTLIEKIRQRDSRIPIVVLSAYSHQHYLFRAIALKLEEFLIKPITFKKIDDLLHKVEKLSRPRRSSQTIFDDKATSWYDWHSKCGYHDAKRIDLTHRQIQMLELLIEAKNKPLRYEQIEEVLDLQSNNNRNAIKCVIRDLRQKFPSLIIKTIPKLGYQLQ